MLDKTIKVIVNKLNGISAGVNSQRDKWEHQRGSDPRAQTYPGTALSHPEGNTTALRKSYERAQQTYAKARQEWLKEGSRLVQIMIAVQVARERRDEIRAAFLKHEAAEKERLKTGVHPLLKEWFAGLFAHRVTPAMLELPAIITAIIADIIRWTKAGDGLTNPDSPLPELFALYAKRRILNPDGSKIVELSVPGTPTKPTSYRDPLYYATDDLAEMTGWQRPEQDDDALPNGEAQAELVKSTITVAEQPIDQVSEVEPMPNTAITVSQRAASESVSAPETVAMTGDRANALARQIMEQDPFVSICWPAGYPVGNYDREALTRALQDEAAAGGGNALTRRFLTAVREGWAESFISLQRSVQIGVLTEGLMVANREAVKRARDLGLLD